MKNLLATILACISMQSIGQTLLFEDFSDSNFTVNPTWMGDTLDFIINPQKRMQLNGRPEGGNSIIATKYNSKENQQITLSIEMDFSPSKSNSTKVYLYADNFNDLKISRAVYVQIGENGSEDNLGLWVVEEGGSQKIAEGIAGRFALGGKFSLNFLLENGTVHAQSKFDSEPDFKTEFTANLNPFEGEGYFIFNPSYSSTRRDKFYFDSVKIVKIPDTTPPKMVNVFALDSIHVQAEFSEKIDTSNLSIVNFQIENHLGDSISILEKSVILKITPGLKTGEYALLVSNILDLEGNALADTTVLFDFFKEFEPKPGDVLINEFMADPTPSKGLPEVEFIELLNNTSERIILDSWRLEINDYAINLSGVSLGANDLIVLYNENDSIDVEDRENVAFLNDWKSLLNSGSVIKLFGPKTRLIDSVSYSMDFFPNDYKGGASLCKIPNSENCQPNFQWTLSLDDFGGSPGRKNSIESPEFQVVSLEFAGKDSLEVKFTSQPNFTAGNIFIDNHPAEVYYEQSSLNVLTYIITFEGALPMGRYFDVSIEEFASCLGKPLNFEMMRILNPKSAEKADVVLNEILFDPKAQGTDFLELCNKSEDYLSMNSLMLVINEDTMSFPDELIFSPQSYLAITPNSASLQLQYFVENPTSIYEINGLKNMPNDSGMVKLLARDGEVVDSVKYFENFHFSGLLDTEGISLERIEEKSFGSWFSAAENEGGATPGRKNSQLIENENLVEDKKIWLSNEYFSPNNDGFNDVLEISFNLGSIGSMLEINVVTFSGQLVKTLVPQTLQSPESSCFWNGSTDNGEPLPSGIYLISALVFSANGKKEYFKLPILIDFPQR
ncbi:MAG: hypothetical protein ACI9WO_000252 [Sphingobacteriales bacterium]|jgi:hypothetical protein